MIKINTIGRIISGEESGRFVKIQELPDDPPSFLILTAADREFHQEGGDAWVENKDSLQQYFTESHWVVNWDE
ncbi:hypothetical protein ACN6LF_002401 [[Kitasatospora] papulosa]|uniref:hypothetical protein n=1 Tax=Streptomyces TaxID=1883 RepID=UPI0009963DE3|nr:MULTISPECIES: hypothetical protein [Streptomyces]WKV76932.1 hypothetical protein HBB06_01720 [Streptomyces sp. SNU607]WSZ51533.1 hypothetical protein OG337_31090 [[Kitasatospora] papulosa]